MPIYEYQCSTCGFRCSQLQSFKDEPLTDCPACKKPELKKLISAPAFHLKGTGWYATDFKNPTKPMPDSTEKNKQEDSSDKKDKKASEETETKGDSQSKSTGQPDKTVKKDEKSS